MRKDTSGPAFPVQMHKAMAYASMCEDLENGNLSDSDKAYYEATKRALSGMTLRDYFAAKAMPVHMAVLSTWNAGSEEAWHNEIARISYATADAMLKWRAE